MQRSLSSNKIHLKAAELGLVGVGGECLEVSLIQFMFVSKTERSPM